MHIISCRGTDNLHRDNSQHATRAGSSLVLEYHGLTRYHHNYFVSVLHTRLFMFVCVHMRVYEMGTLGVGRIG